MSGYRNAPEKTAEAFIDGDWLRTGDICTQLSGHVPPGWPP